MSTVLSVSLAGLDGAGPWSPGPRAAIRWASAVGFRAVQLDATAPGTRPRELDRSGRRDLAALLRRLELTCTGLDLWIPEQHFTDAGHTDRAVTAASQALEMAVEFGGVVSGAVPVEAGDAIAALSVVGDTHGVVFADHSWPATASLAPSWRFGLDPARVLLAGDDPVNAAFTNAPRHARLCDIASEGRVAPGAGGLDVQAYAAALATAAPGTPVVLDLRAIRDPQLVVRDAQERWGGAQIM
jgi:sugar phosphate isomerase/epimerase